MKGLIRIILLLVSLAAAGQAFAQQDLTGRWDGKLPVDAKTTLNIQFTFSKKPDGTYAAVLDSADGNIKAVAANSVTYTAGALKVDVAALSGSFAGTLKDGKLDGKWTQPGQSLPLVLTAYQKPVLSKAAGDLLVGGWHGPITAPGATLTFVTRFKRDAKGELVGTLSVPEQGGVELPMSDIQFADNKLDFKIAQVGGELAATYANGTFTGTWHQRGAPPDGLPVVLKKGDVAAPIFPLKLSAESFAALVGKWNGKLTTPQATVNLVMRFEVNGGGQYVGYIDIPDQNMKGQPLAEADLTAGKFTAKVGGAPAQFEGTLAGKTLTGSWIAQGPQGPITLPLTLTRQ